MVVAEQHDQSKLLQGMSACHMHDPLRSTLKVLSPFVFFSPSSSQPYLVVFLFNSFSLFTLLLFPSFCYSLFCLFPHSGVTAVLLTNNPSLIDQWLIWTVIPKEDLQEEKHFFIPDFALLVWNQQSAQSPLWRHKGSLSMRPSKVFIWSQPPIRKYSQYL